MLQRDFKTCLHVDFPSRHVAPLSLLEHRQKNNAKESLLSAAIFPRSSDSLATIVMSSNLWRAPARAIVRFAPSWT